MKEKIICPNCKGDIEHLMGSGYRKLICNNCGKIYKLVLQK